MAQEYSIEEGVYNFLGAVMDQGDPGTGILIFVHFGKNLLGNFIPPSLINYSIKQQNALFGGYPTPWDVPPSIFFAVFYGVCMIIHILIFSINFSRGHYFWLSIAWAFYCMMKVPAFVLRVYWAKHNDLVEIALASSVLHIVPAYYLVSLNLILTQRLFTWRHPVGGSRWLFWNTMFALYAIALLIMGVIISCTFIPYIYYLRRPVFHGYAIPVQATAVAIVLYVLISVVLIALAYLFPPTTKDENLYTYQPWWVESFNPFYFVEKGAAQRAESTFMRRNHNHRHAIRVIAATHHHYKVVQGLSNQRGSLKHNFSIIMISVSTALILVGALLRCVVVFQFRPQIYGGLVSKPPMAYLTWGAFEGIVMILYIVGRADLRFYRPDVLPREVREIITALQTQHLSEDEAEIEDHRAEVPVYVSEEEEASFDKITDTETSLSIDSRPPYPTDDFDFDFNNSQSLKQSKDARFKKYASRSDDESLFKF